jgi:hypothetical protein
MEKKEVRDKSTLEKMRMTNILRKLEFIKMTIILGRKYSFVVTHRVSESCIMSDNIVIYNLGGGVQSTTKYRKNSILFISKLLFLLTV